MSRPVWSRAHWPLCLQMLSFMHAQHSFFQQGYSLLHQLDPYMKKLAAEVSLGGWAQARVSGEGGARCLSDAPNPTAGPAGDRLCCGEARDGAQARGHPAAGEGPGACSQPQPRGPQPGAAGIASCLAFPPAQALSARLGCFPLEWAGRGVSPISGSVTVRLGTRRC